MRCSRIKEYDDRMIVEEEHTCEYVQSIGDLFHDSVIGAASPWCWTSLLGPLLIHHWCHDSQ
jgi:hypothetical protein